MEKSVYLQDGIIHITRLKDQDEEAARKVVLRTGALIQENKLDPGLGLIESRTQGNDNMARGARQVYAEALKGPMKDAKVAMVNHRVLGRVVFNFVMQASGKKDWKVFNDAEKAR